LGVSELLYQGYDELRDRLEAARRACARVYVTENLSKFVALFCGVLLVLTLLAAAAPPSEAVRWMMLAALLSTLAVGAVVFVFRPLFRRWTDEELAVRVESRFPEIDNAVINSLQLARDPTVRDHGIVARVIRYAEKDTRSVRFTAAADRRGLAYFAPAAAAVLLALGVFAVGFRGAFARAMQRVLLPGTYVKSVGDAHILEVSPGTTTVVTGDPVRVVVRYRTIGGGSVIGTLTYDAAGTGEVRREMRPVGRDRFTFTLPEVRAPVRYRADIGGTETDLYHISVTERPAVTRIDLVYEFPPYTRRGPRRESDSNGDLKALAGTRARLAITANKAVGDGRLVGYGQGPLRLRVSKENPRRLTGALELGKNGSYTIEIKDRDGNPNRSPVIHRVTALPDQRPTVRITLPGKDVVAEPGDKVNIEFKAGDDFGLAAAELFGRREHAKGPPEVLARWTRFADPRNVQTAHALYLDPRSFKAGDVLEYWVQVTDNRALPSGHAAQTRKTPPFLIKLLDRDQVAQEKIKSLKSWQERLRKVLQQEQSIRRTATAMEGVEVPAQFDPLNTAVLRGQVEARTEVLRIAGDIRPGDANLRRVREVLYKLAGKEMARAVAHAEAMSRAADLAARKAELAPFEREVDQVIATLQKLLDVLPRLEEQAKKEADEDEAFDLSEDTKEQLKDLDRALKDFIDEQKKVIDATQELVQKNVDDWTKEDDRTLKELEATEDKWSQFFKEKHHDLSKLPEQDLANSTLLKELLEVQSEVQMAKDALAKKAKEIATAIEDNGLELAKSLETHIEKWLPDTPDREKWKMEETLGDAEAPMAELPKELEDLVGELMEDEEDLMEEVEDATAGYADSLDKGAGWDAADGPISNMSAQGVTGNRLPNKSEIGGRSGEGRSGKSAGEFVEQDATGKGGRKTPTRLTPDAFEKGQVNDTSKDPVGGSTGGGKASGAGAGGLEGPIPPQVEAKLKNLALKQAELRNRAEKINAQFKIMQWPTPFEETVKEMKQVEVDLRNARYQNVLRRRPVLLKNLKGTRQFLSDQVRIHKDYSSPLPDYLQDEILDASPGGTPRGYERLLKDYYKSISQQTQ
jgi:hypothetical protein